ncbi:MAG: collagen-like protein [Prolixibacteraceae bacterium]|nr:collagen-like protein [Prolixibacteraceae bacterium]
MKRTYFQKNLTRTAGAEKTSKQFTKTFLAVFAALLVFSSCVGPRGFDGLDGKDGRDGIDGLDGRDGRDGIANVGAVIYDVDASSWFGNIDGYSTVLDVPEITDYVYENGAVLVYVLQNEGADDQHFNQLPYTWLNNTYTEYMDFNAFVGSIEIILRWVDNGVNNTEAPTGPYAFKVIVIEGTPLAVLEASVDISNPEAVMSFFQ